MWLDKFNEMRAKSGLSLDELAAKSGVPKGTLAKISAGITRAPTLENMRSLVYAMGYTLADLDEIQKAPSDISEEAKKLAQDYDHRLDTWGQRAVRGLTDTEMARVASAEPEQGSTPQKDEKPTVRVTALPKAKRRRDGFIEIETYDQPAAAGLGNYLDTPPSHMEQYPAELVPDRTDFGVLISGDSMEPEIPDGATVFVQSAPTVNAGEVGIFILNGQAYCKMLYVDHGLGQVRLVSVNSAYADIPIGEADELRTLGRVLGHYAPRRWG